ncbi:protein app1-like [Felis catus]|uniref:protein app1-like n=1 Tax=Felis catus TaxID=9685 RepID=UPI001D19A94A|nr:protein app1-like [Felis catus]XP_044912834.1 protein app1-like [Felis catus]XP_044912835.1 protein app1-like [Felis catus]
MAFSILGTWLDQYPQDFFQPPHFIRLKMLQAYVGVHIPGSKLQCCACLLYSSWRNREPQEPESWASQPKLAEDTTHPGAQQLEESVTLHAASLPVQVLVAALIHCQELEEPPAPLVDPEPEQPPSPAVGVMEGLEQPPAAASQPKLAEDTTHPGAQQLEEAVTLPTASPQVRVVVPVLIHCQELEEPHVPLEDPEVEQPSAPAVGVAEGLDQPPAAALQCKLAKDTTHPRAQHIEELSLPAANPPVQVVVPALIHCQGLEEPPAPLVDPQPEQPPAPAGGGMEGLEQPPAVAEQPALAPEQRLMLAAAPKDEFPSAVIAVFLIFVVCIEIFNGLMYFLCK